MARSLVLTRFLYWKDEVELSLISSLLKGEYFEEVLFWLYELYYSGFKEESFHLAWKIYYDFYAHLNPKLDGFIIRNYEKWKLSKDDMIIGYIYRNMFGKSFTFKVFHLRQYMNTNPSPNTVFKGRAPSWVKDYPSNQKNLLMSIDKNKYVNICSYLNMLKDSELKDAYLNIVKYFHTELGLSVKNDIIEETIKSFEKRLFNDKRHFILSTILYLREKESNIDLRKIFISLCQEDEDSIKKLEEERITPDWRTLCYKRCYYINDIIGSFELGRNSVENIEHEMWFHWEYYASFAPRWNKRMAEFKYSRNNKEKTIEFPDEDIMEEFYQKYGFLEPDEQPRIIQDTSTGKIDKKSWKTFYNDFNEPGGLVLFEDEFHYKY